MALPVLKLFPRPRELTLRGGWLKVPPLPHPTALFIESLPSTMEEARAALAESTDGACRIVHQPECRAEGYHIEILSSGIRLNAGDAHGVLYGAQTLRQIAAQYPDELPHLVIIDSPDLPVRGFMLDVSRTRVPTQAELRDLVRALGRLRVNQLQLYIEHTFAFPGHEDAWKDASPLTPAEIRELDDACAAVGIELVPNLNTFGHMERWLRHPRYRAMAECPEGWVHPLTGQFKEFPGTLRPDQASVDFAGALLDGYLPNFRSRQVNIGGDEPWELGQGFSKQAVAERGKHRVYLDHLKKLCALGRDRGRTVQFWGDILLEDLALAQENPSTAPADAAIDHRLAAAEAVEDLERAFGVADRTRTDTDRLVVVQDHHRLALHRQIDRGDQPDRTGADHDNRMPRRCAGVLVGAGPVGKDGVAVGLHRTDFKPRLRPGRQLKRACCVLAIVNG